LKAKTLYISMSVIIVLSVGLFAVINLFNLQNALKPFVNTAVNQSGPPKFTQSFYGGFDDPLGKPMDVAKVGKYVYVSDAKGQKIQVFDQSGTQVFKFGKSGDKEGQFGFPYGIAGDEKGHIYVADLYSGKISIFDSKGKFIKYFIKDGLSSPGGLRIFGEKVYVTDIKENKVFIYNLDGKKLKEIGGAGVEDGKFIAPNAVTVDKYNNIYVTDSGNNRVQVFDKNGKFLKNINGSKDGKGTSIFVNPRGIAVSPDGTVYIVNSLSHNIYACDKNGKQLFELGGMGTENDQLYLPNGLFMDENGSLFVTDTVNQRVSEFN
jgi:DNA-binding beta-propeller fold protein YncE